MIISQQRFSGSMFVEEAQNVHLCAQHVILLSSTSARWEGYVLDVKLVMKIELFTALKCYQISAVYIFPKKTLTRTSSSNTQHVSSCIHVKSCKNPCCTFMKLWSFSITWIVSTSSKLINSVTLEVTPWMLEELKHVQFEKWYDRIRYDNISI